MNTGGERGIIRPYGPHPFGAALRVLTRRITRSGWPRQPTNNSGRVAEPYGRYPSPSQLEAQSHLHLEATSDASLVIIGGERERERDSNRIQTNSRINKLLILKTTLSPRVPVSPHSCLQDRLQESLSSSPYLHIAIPHTNVT